MIGALIFLASRVMTAVWIWWAITGTGDTVENLAWAILILVAIQWEEE